MTLEGRIVGPWVAELHRVWAKTSPRMGKRTLSIDLRDVTYSDAGGNQLLREIYAETRATLVTGTLWAQYLADEIRKSNTDGIDEESVHGNQT